MAEVYTAWRPIECKAIVDPNSIFVTII